jgi:hypothetical protein
MNFSIPPQLDSAGKEYSLHLSTDYGSIDVMGRKEDIYPRGQAFIGIQPGTADISFSTTYDYDISALIDDINNWLSAIYLIPSFLIVLILPGLVLFYFLKDHSTFDYGQRISISIGLSLAIIPIILVWTSELGIRWTSTTVLFLSGFFVSIYIFLVMRSRAPKLLFDNLGLNDQFSLLKSISKFIPEILLLGIFLLSLLVRLIMVRDLATPAWVDSVHHALITRIILETGSLPETYLPYIDVESKFYHSGFHSQLATLELLSNLDVHEAMLVYGQVINALMIFVVYAFTKHLTNSRVASLFAALITGLFTPMPAYYTSWGRYTQLSGLLILPIAYLLFQNAFSQLNTKRAPYLQIIIAAIAAGGLFLVHYRVTAFFILLIVSEFLISFILSNNQKYPDVAGFYICSFTYLFVFS